MRDWETELPNLTRLRQGIFCACQQEHMRNVRKMYRLMRVRKASSYGYAGVTGHDHYFRFGKSFLCAHKSLFLVEKTLESASSGHQSLFFGVIHVVDDKVLFERAFWDSFELSTIRTLTRVETDRREPCPGGQHGFLHWPNSYWRLGKCVGLGQSPLFSSWGRWDFCESFFLHSLFTFSKPISNFQTKPKSIVYV